MRDRDSAFEPALTALGRDERRFVNLLLVWSAVLGTATFLAAIRVLWALGDALFARCA